MNDLQGRPLIPFRVTDLMRHKPVWSVYKIAREGLVAECQSDVSFIATAKAKVDALNADRQSGYYFKVFRLATPSERRAGRFGESAVWR